MATQAMAKTGSDNGLSPGGTLLALCEGNPPMTGGFPYKGQLRGAVMLSLISAWTNGWTNSLDAGDLRLHGVHYEVTVCHILHYDFIFINVYITLCYQYPKYVIH